MFGSEILLMPLLLLILWIAIVVAISRWVFRINHIVERLDKIITLLSGKS